MILSRLEPMEAEPAALNVWVQTAARSQEPIELHVTPRGWDLRCGDMPPFDFHPAPERRTLDGKRRELSDEDVDAIVRGGKRAVDPETEDSRVIPDPNAHRPLPD